MSIVVFAKPMRGVEYREGLPNNPVTILVLAGSTERGYQEGRTALVVDKHGNLDWIGTDGLGVTDPAILPDNAQDPS